jgi:hypothetical protein
MFKMKHSCPHCRQTQVMIRLFFDADGDEGMEVLIFLYAIINK